MAVDIEKIRSKLENLKNPSSGKFKKYTWKPKDDGTPSTIRLIDYPFSDEQFEQLWFHYNIGRGRPIPCPRYMNGGKSCPVCEFGNTIKDKEVAKKLWAKPRYFAASIDREDEVPEPRYWGFSKTVYIELLEGLVNEDYRDYLDPLKGIDIVVKSSKIEGKTFAQVGFTFRRNDSRLAETDKEIKAIMEAIVPIEEVFPPMTNSEIKARLEEWLDLSEDPEEDSHETVKGKRNMSEDNIEDIDKELEKALG